MRPRRLPHVAVALATLVAPLAAFAQPLPPGSVATAPLVAAVPAMGMPLLILLTVVLAGGGAYFLRRAAGGVIAAVGLVVVLTALAGLAYAPPPTVRVEGAQCGMRTAQDFFPNGLLLSQCSNRIQIISIQLSCPSREIPLGGTCSEGQVLAYNGSCILPECGIVTVPM